MYGEFHQRHYPIFPSQLYNISLIIPAILLEKWPNKTVSSRNSMKSKNKIQYFAKTPILIPKIQANIHHHKIPPPNSIAAAKHGKLKSIEHASHPPPQARNEFPGLATISGMAIFGRFLSGRLIKESHAATL